LIKIALPKMQATLNQSGKFTSKNLNFISHKFTKDASLEI